MLDNRTLTSSKIGADWPNLFFFSYIKWRPYSELFWPAFSCIPTEYGEDWKQIFSWTQMLLSRWKFNFQNIVREALCRTASPGVSMMKWNKKAFVNQLKDFPNPFSCTRLTDSGDLSIPLLEEHFFSCFHSANFLFNSLSTIRSSTAQRQYYEQI